MPLRPRLGSRRRCRAGRNNNIARAETTIWGKLLMYSDRPPATLQLPLGEGWSSGNYGLTVFFRGFGQVPGTQATATGIWRRLFALCQVMAGEAGGKAIRATPAITA
jgi:hypothetical protein